MPFLFIQHHIVVHQAPKTQQVGTVLTNYNSSTSKPPKRGYPVVPHVSHFYVPRAGIIEDMSNGGKVGPSEPQKQRSTLQVWKSRKVFLSWKKWFAKVFFFLHWFFFFFQRSHHIIESQDLMYFNEGHFSSQMVQWDIIAGGSRCHRFIRQPFGSKEVRGQWYPKGSQGKGIRHNSSTPTRPSGWLLLSELLPSRCKNNTQNIWVV